MIAAVGNVERAIGVNVNAVRLVQFRLQGRSANASPALFSRPSNTDNFAFVKKIFADDMILCVGNEDVAVEIEAEMLRSV